MSELRQRKAAAHQLQQQRLAAAPTEIPSTFTPPSFTIKDLLGAIPKHCFERSALRSGSYLVADLLVIGAFVYLATFIDVLFGSSGSLVAGAAGDIARVVAWAIYGFCTGCVATGVWVIAHECGHQAFSTSKTINNTVGWIFHSLLLVPYHSWRISHARHHAATGSMERDEVFVPKTRTQLGYKSADQMLQQEHKQPESFMERVDEILEDAPFYVLINLFLQQTVGWPLYLIKNASGQSYGNRWTNHFDPKSAIFDRRHFWQVIASDIGLIAVAAMLTLWGQYRSSGEVVRYYLIPYLVVNHHLVLITYLQHTDPALPHYRKGEWNFQRGALCTMDRALYGKLGEVVFHGIAETHIAHHLSSKIPHYHAWEATEALKAVLGDYYMKSEENIYVSLFKSYDQCRYVEDQGSCVFYKNKRGQAKRVVVYEEDSGVGGMSDGSASSGEEPDMDIEA